MASGIYAVANIGRFQLFVGDASKIETTWPQLMAILNNGTHPHAALQQEWNKQGEQRRFTFHTRKEIADNQKIIGIEQIDT
ncbi:hypothetical protein Cylst_2099 [Cylindrospermum stagnale PCC 7417]|uniref:GIY-YIG nuclease family protein n=1 Tax=Cylindrospermum stagnale PCC 7417 TaxID=56107 RepID=K9WVU8_9NOST|nr:hypothetical protein [Cylindrospermum stagnale]AFZ24338.1 hypothetical protein Cylst_2099 [Cylindrospermum stagnale PCC 7417]